MLDGPLVTAKYCAIRSEFQERDSPHVHIRVFHAPNIQNEAAYIGFIGENNKCSVAKSFES